MYRTQTCSLCDISVKKQWSSQGCVERHLYSYYSVIPTHVHLSLNFPVRDTVRIRVRVRVRVRSTFHRVNIVLEISR